MHTNVNRVTVTAGIIAGAILVAGYFLLSNGTSVENTIDAFEAQSAIVTSTALPIAVSGLVSASDKAIVSAQTAGAITQFHVVEGSRVTAGTVLVDQATPVSDAELALRAAETHLTTAQQSARVDGAETAAQTAAVVAYSAADIARINAVSSDNRVSEATAGLLTSARESVTTMLEALQFVNTHRSLFDGESLTRYNNIVEALYATAPKHFQSTLAKPVGSSDDLLSALEAFEQTTEPVPLEVSDLAALVGTQVQTLLTVYSGAEADVLDRTKVSPESAEFEQYFANRTALLAAQSGLTTQLAETQTALDTAATGLAGDGQSVAVTALDEAAAVRQAAFSADIAAAAEAVAQAASGVTYAQRSLGAVTAPFAGVVTKRFKTTGEYAAPGEPLLELQGVGGTEVLVTVPSVLVPTLAVGQSFVVDDRTVGVVDRFAPVAVGNGVTVVIALTDPSVSVGSTITGHIMAAPNDAIAAFPRAYVHFASDGAYVRTTADDRFPVTILYDGGDTLFTTAVAVDATSLVPAYSIALP